MNWLDIIMIILAVAIFVGAIACLVYWIKGYETGFGIFLALTILFCEIVPIIYFGVFDKGAGSAIGTITSVDRNFFGTTSIYIKTSENLQERYCIEEDEIVNQAHELIGQDVKISYGTRVGLYSTNKCHSAPVDKIEAIND